MDAETRDWSAASGLVTFLTGAAGLTVEAVVMVSSALRAVLASSDLPNSKMEPAIWIEPTTTATMLAAMNSDLTRFIILLRSDGASGSSSSRTSGACGGGGGARSAVFCTAAVAARRAAALKPDVLPGAAAFAAELPSAASDMAMRAPGLARNFGGPEPGSSG